ncbi:MAG: nicotinamide riboside transporter PnuC [Halieaceae bacterium]|jgi:nicotinamide mononucleotide transporter
MSWTESCAVALALAYVLLAVYQHRWCWIAAILSALLYIVIFWRVQLYLEAILQCFYIGMAAYGWFAWGKSQANPDRPIATRPWHFHLRSCAALLTLSLLLGSMMMRWTDAAAPFIDAATTVSALLATWLVAQKILENWLYWIVIDVASAWLYLSRDLSLTAALFAGYVVLAAFGYRTWRTQWLQQQTT